MNLDKDRRAGFWIFKWPDWDSLQAGAGEHDDDHERKAKCLPTRFSRSGGNSAFLKAWEAENEGRFKGRDRFARMYERSRQVGAKAAIWFFQKVLGLWKSGRVKVCMIDERGECICLRDLDRYGNKKE